MSRAMSTASGTSRKSRTADVQALAVGQPAHRDGVPCRIGTAACIDATRRRGGTAARAGPARWTDHVERVARDVARVTSARPAGSRSAPRRACNGRRAAPCGRASAREQCAAPAPRRARRRGVDRHEGDPVAEPAADSPPRMFDRAIALRAVGSSPRRRSARRARATRPRAARRSRRAVAAPGLAHGIERHVGVCDEPPGPDVRSSAVCGAGAEIAEIASAGLAERIGPDRPERAQEPVRASCRPAGAPPGRGGRAAAPLGGAVGRHSGCVRAAAGAGSASKRSIATWIAAAPSTSAWLRLPDDREAVLQPSRGDPARRRAWSSGWESTAPASRGAPRGHPAQGAQRRGRGGDVEAGIVGQCASPSPSAGCITRRPEPRQAVQTPVDVAAERGERRGRPSKRIVQRRGAALGGSSPKNDRSSGG